MFMELVSFSAWFGCAGSAPQELRRQCLSITSIVVSICFLAAMLSLFAPSSLERLRRIAVPCYSGLPIFASQLTLAVSRATGVS
jgi:hypothetical protein